MGFPEQIKKFVSLALLLIFLQKIGGGLFAHNYFHNPNKEKHAHHGKIQLNNPWPNCNCIDDFSTPFAEAQNELNSFVSREFQTLNSFYIQSIPFSCRIFTSLRAPPALLPRS